MGYEITKVALRSITKSPIRRWTFVTRWGPLRPRSWGCHSEGTIFARGICSAAPGWGMPWPLVTP